WQPPLRTSACSVRGDDGGHRLTRRGGQRRRAPAAGPGRAFAAGRPGAWGVSAAVIHRFTSGWRARLGVVRYHRRELSQRARQHEKYLIVVLHKPRRALMVARKIPTVPQRALANALERRREAAGLSREDVNSALEWSSMKLYRIETARVTVSPGDIRELALLYQLADAETEALVALARQAKRPGWWKGMSGSLPAGFSVHLELESAAQAIRS